MKFTSMKDIATWLMDIAEQTGYAYEMLAGEAESLVKEDGASWTEAVRFVSTVALEGDF